jgi:hypothetical protein
MSHSVLLAVAAALALLAPRAGAQQMPAIEIQTANGTAVESRGKAQLERVLGTWDLERYLFTRTVRIETRIIPHSHPVLTLSAEDVPSDTAQMATFVHEQLHWFVNTKPEARDSTVAELARLFPDAPDGPGSGGARDRRSTLLHLLVCQLEYDSVRDLVGDPAARRVIGSYTHYPWIYREVLERPEPLRLLIRKYGLDRPDARRGSGDADSLSSQPEPGVPVR